MKGSTYERKAHGKRVVSTQRKVLRKKKDQKWGTTHGKIVVRN